MTTREDVLKKRATEPAFSGKLLHNKEKGSYYCGGCGAKLFVSDTKFDSGSGWPSFTDAVKEAVERREDLSHGMKRIEVVCKKCGGHLGHVFDDGPNGCDRYCINSVALDFKH